jgi:hypothetical protein
VATASAVLLFLIADALRPRNGQQSRPISCRRRLKTARTPDLEVAPAAGHTDPYNSLISKRLVLRLDADLFGSSCGIVPAARIAILANAFDARRRRRHRQDYMSGFST